MIKKNTFSIVFIKETKSMKIPLLTSQKSLSFNQWIPTLTKMDPIRTKFIARNHLIYYKIIQYTKIKRSHTF